MGLLAVTRALRPMVHKAVCRPRTLFQLIAVVRCFWKPERCASPLRTQGRLVDVTGLLMRQLQGLLKAFSREPKRRGTDFPQSLFLGESVCVSGGK